MEEAKSVEKVKYRRPSAARIIAHIELDSFWILWNSTKKGLTTPIRPCKIFTADEAADAFRYMQKGNHIGRVGISIPHAGDDTEPAFKTSKSLCNISFDKSGSYLLVGGLGGLGRAIATWMVEHGAGELLFLSRSAGKANRDQLFADELRSMGCDVKLLPGDVTDANTVAEVIGSASRPMKGVVQMSMVLRDQNFTSMTFDEWNAAVAPKVQGSWNLHNATLANNSPLDFFVLFSSLSGIIGQPGQANYASANTFLDAFAQYRNNQGLVASVVDIGAVEGIGFISENQGMITKMKTSGFKSISEQELLDAMTLAMIARPSTANQQMTSTDRLVSHTSFVLGLGSSVPMDSPSNRAVWRKDRRMAAYHNSSAGDGANAAASTETLKSFIASARADLSILRSAETARVFAVDIGKKLFDLLLKPDEEVNISLPLVDLGLDSLVALELRAWWKQVFGTDITVLEMLGMGSLDALGQHAAATMLTLAAEQAEQAEKTQ